MKELFDVIAGTSTGAILAAVLSVKDDPKVSTAYYASDVIDFFEKDGPLIFYKNKINNGLLGIAIFISMLMGATFGLKIGKRIYANPKIEKDLK